MTTRVVTDEQLGQLSRKQHDLFRRVREGSIPIDVALKGLQSLIESKPPSKKKDNSWPDHYKIQVSYNGLPQIKELEKRFAGEGSVGNNFDGRPWERYPSCKNISELPGNRVFWTREIPEEFLSRSIEESWDGLDRHIAQDYRFAIETEAVEFASAEPTPQLKYWIFALGSFVQNPGSARRVTLLRSGGFRKRLLQTYETNIKLSHDHRLLLVRK